MSKPLLAVLCAVLSMLSISTTPAADTLINPGDTWRLRFNTSAPPANWQMISEASLDATWQTAPGGFGYGDAPFPNQATTLTTMNNGFRSICIRKTFNVPSALDTNLILNLIFDYDDGVAAWLDGVLVVSNNTPANFAHNTSAPADREASCCGATANPPQTNTLGFASTLLAPGDHVLAIQGWNQSITSSDFHLIPWLQTSTPPTNPPGCVSGTIAANTNWTVADSPIMVCAALNIASGVTLTIDPGVTVMVSPGVTITVNGRLIAEGNETNRIRFQRANPASAWTRILVNGGTNESRFAFCDVSGASSSNIRATSSRLYVDNVWFTNTTAQLVDCNSSSLILKNCYIPGGAGVEPVHFTTMPADGYALIQGCVFDAPRGYNDSVDFTGGNRPGPIAQFLDNVFLGGVDDCFDMDGTDAHIEGNIFLNVRKDASRDSSSNPITTGANGSALSQLVICRNIFYNTEHMFMQKDNGMGLLQNNTVLRITPNPLSNNTDPAGNEAPGIIMFGEPWRYSTGDADAFGNGAIFEGNIASDLQITDPWPVLGGAEAADASFFFVRDHNCVQGFPQPGLGNISVDPLFVSPSNLTAANIRQSLALQPGSPCLGTGPNGLDMGALVSSGASISGAPVGITTNTSATLRIAGPGIWSYRWRLDGGAWSAEVSLVPQTVWNGQQFTATMFSNGPPITLSNLVGGDHTVEVIGRNSAGYWQDINAAASVTWTVETTPTPQLLSASRTGNTASITFIAEEGKTYSVFYRDAFDPAHPWTKLGDVPPQGATAPYTYTDPTLTLPATRFYRIVTPAQ